jgi:hypothetical protein
MGANLKLREENITFRRKQTYLKKLNKILEDVEDEVVEALLKILRETKDEGKRMQAATKLMDLRIQVSGIINTDEIQRLLLETKNPDRVRNLVPEDDDVPQINFTDIVDAD